MFEEIGRQCSGANSIPASYESIGAGIELLAGMWAPSPGIPGPAPGGIRFPSMDCFATIPPHGEAAEGDNEKPGRD